MRHAVGKDVKKDRARGYLVPLPITGGAALQACAACFWSMAQGIYRGLRGGSVVVYIYTYIYIYICLFI